MSNLIAMNLYEKNDGRHSEDINEICNWGDGFQLLIYKLAVVNIMRVFLFLEIPLEGDSQEDVTLNS